MGCTLCSSATGCRDIEWTIERLLCSGYVPWLDRLKAVFYKEQNGK